MLLIQYMSFRNKVMLLVVFLSSLVLLLAMVAVGFVKWSELQKSYIQHASTEAEIIATNSTAALVYDNHEDGKEILQAMTASPQAVAAAIFKSDGSTFATWQRNGNTTISWPAQIDDYSNFIENQTLHVFRPIILQNEQLGILYICYNLHDKMIVELQKLTATLSIVMAFCLFLAILVSAKFHKVITYPILQLVKLTQIVTETKDYSVRTLKFDNSEIGTLAVAFNNMLEQIQTRDIELEEAREGLEKRVQERTTDLARTNELLHEEIAGRVKTERKLQRSMELAEAANRSKSEFLANMSHEIRTPMTAILGYTDLLADPEQSLENQQECVETIRRNGKHLLTIINDILDISKLEAGAMTVENIPCSPIEMVAEVVSLMRVRALEKDINFDIEFIGQIPQTIHTDPTRLRQIIMNIIGNAIKFTSVGGVRIITRLLKCDTLNSPDNFISFEVVDSGIGLSEAQIATLFQPFSQADCSMSRKFGGTGLGLAISKRLAQKLGGDIKVHSTLNVGSSFVITIRTGSLDGVTMLDNPREAVLNAPTMLELNAQTFTDESAYTRKSQSNQITHNRTPQNNNNNILPETNTSGNNDKDDEKIITEKPKPLSGYKILLVEDGVDNQRLISFILKKAGAEVDIAENGKIGVDKIMATTALGADAASANTPYNVTLMDMQMPVMDGYTAVALLRNKGYKGTIIALTAHAMDGDRDKCINAGCDDYATKPVDRNVLVKTVLHYASMSHSVGVDTNL